MANNSSIENNDYKETELEVLPKDWGITNVGQFIELETGKRMKGGAITKGIPSIGGEHIDRAGRLIFDNMKYISEEFYDELKQGKILVDDILIVKDGATTGKTAIVRDLNFKKMAVNEHVFLLRKKSDLIRSDFLFFYIFSDEGQEQIRRNYHGLIGGIKREDVLNLQIRVPPLFEQQKIAHVLRSVQEAKEKTETVIRTTKELKKSMMKHLFTYGPVSLEDVEKVELKETETGVVPKDWKLITIGEVFDLKQGKQLSDRESKTNKIQRPFLRTSNLFWGKISTSKLDLMYFTPEEFETLKLMKGDILVCEGGDIGRTALYQEDSMEIAYQNHLHRLRPLNDRIFNEFFVFWIDHAINQRGLYIHAANRTTIPNLSGSRLKGFFIPFPAVSIQMQISKVLVDINSKLEAEEAKKKALEELFKTLLRDLMTAKIRVKDLVINNA